MRQASVIIIAAGSLAILALPSRAVAQPRPSSGAAVAPDPRDRSVLFVSRIVTDGSTESLRRRIDREILMGLRTAKGAQGEKLWFPSFHSYDQMREARQSEGILEVLADLEQDLSVNFRTAREKLARLPNKPTHLLRVEASRSEDRTLRVRMELLELEGGSLKRVKSVGSCGGTDEEILNHVAEAARSLRRLDKDDKPTPWATVTGHPHEGIAVGEPVTLDGCWSHDPDYDALLLRWTQKAAPFAIPAEGVPGRRLRFTPTEEGRYLLELTVWQEVGPDDTRNQASVPLKPIPVYSRPRAVAGESRIVTWTGAGTDVDLDSTGSFPEQRKTIWRQTGGPAVTFSDPNEKEQGNPARQGFCEAGKCNVRFPSKGLYVFQLEVQNGPLIDRAVVRYLVASRPEIDFRNCFRTVDIFDDAPVHKRGEKGSECRIRTAPNRLVELKAQIRPDDADREPFLVWRLSGTGRTAMLTDPYSHAPTFTASELGEYRVDVLVHARRRLGDRELWDVGTAQATVEVVRPTATIFFSPTLEIPFGDGTPAPYVTSTIGYYFVVSPESRFGFRVTGSFGKIALGLLESDDEARFQPDVAGTGALAFSIPFSRVEFVPYAGYHLAWRDQYRSEHGPDGGVQIVTRPYWTWGLIFHGGYRYVMSPRHDGYHMMHLSVGAGVRDL